jgi:hypothetical protein
MSDEVFKNPKFDYLKKLKGTLTLILMLIQFHTLDPRQPYKYCNKHANLYKHELY